jgi:hypothetical protein
MTIEFDELEVTDGAHSNGRGRRRIIAGSRLRC